METSCVLDEVELGVRLTTGIPLQNLREGKSVILEPSKEGRWNQDTPIGSNGREVYDPGT